MKRIAILSPFVALALMITALPALSVETVIDNRGKAGQKDECILLAKNCGNEAYGVEGKIDKLKAEISKGKRVYTPEELEILNQKLNNLYKVRDYFKNHDPGVL